MRVLTESMRLKWGARPSRSHPSASRRRTQGQPAAHQTVSPLGEGRFLAERRKQRAGRHALPSKLHCSGLTLPPKADEWRSTGLQPALNFHEPEGLANVQSRLQAGAPAAVSRCASACLSRRFSGLEVVEKSWRASIFLFYVRRPLCRWILFRRKVKNRVEDSQKMFSGMEENKLG